MVLGLLSAQSEDGQLGVESGVNPFSLVLAVSAPMGMGGGGWSWNRVWLLGSKQFRASSELPSVMWAKLLHPCVPQFCHL